MTAGKWDLKAASMGSSALRKERETCDDMKRLAVLQRQIPLYEAEVAKFKAAAKKEKAA